MVVVHLLHDLLRQNAPLHPRPLVLYLVRVICACCREQRLVELVSIGIVVVGLAEFLPQSLLRALSLRRVMLQ